HHRAARRHGAGPPRRLDAGRGQRRLPGHPEHDRRQRRDAHQRAADGAPAGGAGRDLPNLRQDPGHLAGCGGGDVQPGGGVAAQARPDHAAGPDGDPAGAVGDHRRQPRRPADRGRRSSSYPLTIRPAGYRRICEHLPAGPAVTFGVLTLIAGCGLAGPLLSAATRLAVPVVVGEIIAGLVIGRTGFGLLDLTDPTLIFLSAVGFAMLMFVVGTRLPLRDARLRRALGRAVVATVVSFAVAAPVGWLIAGASGIHHPALFGLLLAAS